MKLTRCKVCGEPLRDPESIKKQIGPVCAGRLESFLAAAGSSAEEIAALALIDENISRLLRAAERAAGFGHAANAKSLLERARRCAQAYNESETAEVKAA